MKFLKVLGVIFASFVTLSWQCDIHSLKHHHSESGEFGSGVYSKEIRFSFGVCFCSYEHKL